MRKDIRDFIEEAIDKHIDDEELNKSMKKIVAEGIGNYNQYILRVLAEEDIDDDFIQAFEGK